MKIFYCIGPNCDTVHGTSSKIWKIERRGNMVRTWFGSVDVVNRKYVPRGALRASKPVTFETEEAAVRNELRRIADQLKQGYRRKLRKKSDRF